MLVDLDGTLIEFAPSPAQATLDDDAAAVLLALRESGARVVVVSGRPSADIDAMRSRVPGAWWVAEHGSWLWNDECCIRSAAAATELDGLTERLQRHAAAGALVERKSLSVCVHWRRVAPADRAAFVEAMELACDEWLEEHHDFERLIGVEVLEVRKRSTHKGLAVDWVRQQVPGVRIIAIGDDVTDEDMFAELADGDAAIAVGGRYPYHRADAAVASPGDVRAFLRWIVEARAGRENPVPISPIVHAAERARHSLVVVSNRTPTVVEGRAREVGGLVSALEPALREEPGVWLGWSGLERAGDSRIEVHTGSHPVRATFDLAPAMREAYYAGFCNGALWPLFHGFPTRVRYNDGDWEAYVRANERFARHALEIARPDATIWVHDYHLLLVARALRRAGHRGRIGFFLHVPFPTRDLFETIPWGSELLAAMLDYDLLGFQSERWAVHFVAAAQGAGRPAGHDGAIASRYRVTEIGVFPATIDARAFRQHTEELPEIASLRASLGDRQMLLAVDRLDYSKGLPERLAAFERLLDQFPEWRRRVVLVQVSVPSRADIPEYAALRERVEGLVGKINGRFGETDWVPVRYLYRAYDQPVLAQLYRLADVALVTPLRDGMNLVAKEYVAAQDLADPGVLVLSQYAGAADAMSAAVITNPFHPEGVAADIDRALRMPLAERRERLRALEVALERSGTPGAWAKGFLDRLTRRVAIGGNVLRSSRIPR